MFESMCRPVQNSPIFIWHDGFARAAGLLHHHLKKWSPALEVVFNRLPVENLEETCEMTADMVWKKLEEKKCENSLWTKGKKWWNRAEGLMAIL
ncbi:hypothetical protein Zmor_011216 [Zophobas morio]|uniref:Uncharacterized protein n=1 Tax=Zophobas morio TaxID=2755281 RepID=A0AA38IT99_9CUCU|nr:hypothetical protein Zmor_011216 [Zophobas morio]